MARYWDYWSATDNGTATSGRYYRTWTSTGSTSSTGGGYSSATTASDYYLVQRVEKYLVSGFGGWSEQARATLTRLVNDETHTGFKIEMWIKGDVDVVDMGIQLRDLDWFMLRLRQVARSEDYQKIAECVAEARAEAAERAAQGGVTEGGDGEAGSGSGEAASSTRSAESGCAQP